MGSYTTAAIPAHGQVVLDIATLEANAHVTPADGETYDIKIDGTFNGFIQHVAYHQSARVLSDMTASCAVNETKPTAAFTITVKTAGNGSGTVSSNPSSPAPYGSVAVMTATPAAGSFFLGWAGDCPSIAGCTLYMDRDKNVTAVFGLAVSGPSQFVLNVGASISDGIGGTITSSVGDINCTERGMTVSNALYLVASGSCATVLDKNTVVSVTATPARGSKFVSWTGDTCAGATSTTSTAPTCQLTMAASRHVSAIFGAAP